jgi:hypothetical protein
MTDNFDWRTEEDENDAIWTGKPRSPSSAPLRPGAVVALLLLLFVAGLSAFWLYYQVQARVADVTAAIETDVLALHDLVQQASARGDLELFSPLVSGRDAAWAQVQDELVERGYFRDRPFWGLLADDSDATFLEIGNREHNDARVAVATDLQFATVSYEQSYRLAGAAAEEASVILRQTTFYGAAGAGEFWLLAPPGDDFWGAQESLPGERLVVTFPERDRDLARRLALDLDALLDDLCHRLADLTCPADLDVTLALQSRPESLLNAARLVPEFEGRRAASSLSLALPAPTLVGIPVDETGYQALLAGYSLSLAAATIAYLVDYTCCQGALFFEALVHYQLSRLELRPWPVDGAVYRRLVEETPPLENLIALWRLPAADDLVAAHRWHIYALTDFLLASLPAATAAGLQEQLAGSPTFLAWLISLVGGWPDLAGDSLVIRSLEQQLRYHAYLQLLPGETDLLPRQLPDQDLVLLCYDSHTPADEDSPVSAVYRLDPASGQLDLLQDAAHFSLISRLPDYTAFLLYQVTYAPRLTRTSLYRDGQETLVYSGDQPVLSLGQTDPAGRYGILYIFGAEAGARVSLMPIDAPACDADGCPAELVVGLPLWSPDGSQTLVLWPAAAVTRMPALYWHAGRLVTLHDADALARLYRGNSQGERLPADSLLREVALGYAPFWVDDETYGYVRLSSTGGAGIMLMATPPDVEQEVVLASVRDDEPQALLRLSDLLPFIPYGHGQERPFFIRYVLANPANPDQFVVSLFNASGSDAYLFAFDRSAGSIEHLLTLDHNAGQSASFTSDGRWLVITGNGQTDLVGSSVATTLYLFDWEHDQMERFYIRRSGHYANNPAYDWSSDGRWLAALVGSDHVLLSTPADGHQHLIRHTAGDCVSLVWLDR